MKNVYLFLLPLLIMQANVCQAQTLEEVIGYGLPVVVVNTMDGEEPTSEVITYKIGSITRTSITNAVQKEARMQIYRGGILWYDSGDYIDDVSGIKIRHRGNTSAAFFENKPFKLKLQKKADLIDTQEDGDNTDRRSKDWVLLNNVHTIDLPLAYKLSNLIGLEYTPRMQFVNVIINGNYRGMYVLAENISRDKECRINVDKQDGYIIEFDAYFWKEPLSFKSQFTGYMQWTLKYPDPEDLTAEQMENIRSDIQRFEASVSSQDYPNLIDIKSIAKWMLVHDIMGTRDSGGCNMYVARTDRQDASLMRMPAVWDMASSSMDVLDEWSKSHTDLGLFFSHLFANEQCMEFTKEYVKEWKRIKEENVFDSLIVFIDGYTSTPEGIGVKNSAPHHMQRWSLSYGLVDLERKTVSAKEWMNNRQLWLDENITKMEDKYTAVPTIREMQENDHTNVRKIILGKHLYIIKNGEAYSVDGIRVE